VLAIAPKDFSLWRDGCLLASVHDQALARRLYLSAAQHAAAPGDMAALSACLLRHLQSWMQERGLPADPALLGAIRSDDPELLADVAVTASRVGAARAAASLWRRSASLCRSASAPCSRGSPQDARRP
jgi:hypothetical protein